MVSPRVLFLCSGNSARSQMAEGWLRHLAGDRFDVVSAGTEPSRVNPLAIAVMRERGIDISGHESKSAGKFLGQHFAYLITVCDSAREKCPIFPGVLKRIHWPLEDPAAAVGTDAERTAVFRRSRDDIEGHIRAWLREQEVGPRDSRT
jgi:arsenate reductase (thioredoxin)